MESYTFGEMIWCVVKKSDQKQFINDLSVYHLETISSCASQVIMNAIWWWSKVAWHKSKGFSEGYAATVVATSWTTAKPLATKCASPIQATLFHHETELLHTQTPKQVMLVRQLSHFATSVVFLRKWCVKCNQQHTQQLRTHPNRGQQEGCQ